MGRETALTTRSWTTDTPSPNSPFLIWTRPCPRRQREGVVGSDWLTCLAITTRDQIHLYQKDRFSCPHSKNEELPLKQPSLRVTVIFLLKTRAAAVKHLHQIITSLLTNSRRRMALNTENKCFKVRQSLHNYM